MKQIIYISLLLLFGCGTTKITSSWTAPSAGSARYNKLMVVSSIQTEDSVLRKNMEQHMVGDLKAIGYNAVAYSEEFSPGTFRNMRYDSVRKYLVERGIDGVITIGLLAKEKESVYVKDKVPVRTENLPMGSFWDNSVTIKQEIGKPGYYVTTTQYFWESNFYDVQSVALLYNAKSTAFDVSSAKTLAHKYGKLIVDDMQKKYLLSAAK